MGSGGGRETGMGIGLSRIDEAADLIFSVFVSVLQRNVPSTIWTSTSPIISLKSTIPPVGAIIH